MFAILLTVHILCNQLLLELSMYLYNTLQVYYRHIVDVHEGVKCKKNEHSYFRTLHILNNG